MRLALLLTFAVTACTTGAAGAPCIRHSDCAVGLSCEPGGICAVPPDAPWPDGGIDAVEIPSLPDAIDDAAVDAAPDATIADADLTPDAF